MNGEYLRSLGCTEAPRNLLPYFDHPEILFPLIVGKGDIGIFEATQYAVFEIAETYEEVIALTILLATPFACAWQGGKSIVEV